MRMGKALAPSLVPACLAVLALAGTAQAHAWIDTTTPADGAVLTEPPAQVRVQYTEPMEPRVTTLTLLDGRGKPVAGTRQTPEGDRNLALVLHLPELAGGKYTVKATTLGKDGHPTEETISFTVNLPQAPADSVERDSTGGATVPAQEQGTETPAPKPGRERQRNAGAIGMAVARALSVLALLAGAVALSLLLTRKRR